MMNFGGHQPNCIVGEALMVHFSYYSKANRMVELGFLKEFENIVIMELGETLPRTLWRATDFFLDLCVRMPSPAKIKLVLFETSFVSRHRLSMWFFIASSCGVAIRSANSLFSNRLEFLALRFT